MALGTAHAALAKARSIDQESSNQPRQLTTALNEEEYSTSSHHKAEEAHFGTRDSAHFGTHKKSV